MCGQAERAQLRQLLNGDLLKRRAELTDRSALLEANQASMELGACVRVCVCACVFVLFFVFVPSLNLCTDAQRQSLADAEQRLADCDSRLAEAEQRLEQAMQDLKGAQKELDEAHAAPDVDQRVKDARKRVDELLNERALYTRELEGAKQKIREVGTISSEEFQAYKGKSVEALYKLLHDVQEQLQSYTHINKKAGEQFVSFVDQRDRLMERNAKLDEGQGSIMELIAALDARKDEAILRTFKGVAKHFEGVFKVCCVCNVYWALCTVYCVVGTFLLACFCFSHLILPCHTLQELVPDGAASLTMIKSATGKRKQGADAAEGAGVQAFVGVRIKATFGGAMGAPQDISLLSGGQKSLVALALIFAIQRADPAPFYLMDEVDAALDSTHRAAVAKMLAAQSQGAQYLIATFKQELVQPAQHFYKISFANKVSNIRSVTADEALRVVQEISAQQKQ